MNSNALLAKLPPPVRRQPILLLGLVAAVILLSVLWLRSPKTNGSATAYFEVKRGDFTVSVIEGGTLAAVNEVSIRNTVEGIARIITIVPEGSYAQKGDLLVELDSAQAQDQVNMQQINFEKAKFAFEQASAQLEIARSATNSDWSVSKVKLEMATIDLDKYEQGQRLVDLVEASNKVVQARAQLAVNLDTYINSTNLAAKGYETKMKVDGDGLSVTNTRNSLIVATNGLWMLEQFDVRKQMRKFVSDVEQAKQELQRVISQNERKMLQYLADLTAQSNTLALSEQKLERDRKNLQGTKIYAPQDGLVVYAISDSHFSSESLIEGGASVRNRQELIKLPDLSRMKVNIKVHESHVNMIRPGLPAYVVLDSMPDQRFAARVEKVAPLPDTQARWGNPNLKVYNTEVWVTDTLPNVKPGVSAKAEIIITNIANTLFVPIQAVTSFKGKQVVYLASGAKSEPKAIDGGMYNTKYIQITKGVKEGDRVLLSPPFDTQKDLEGAVLAADEKADVARTNTAPRTGTPPGNAPGRVDTSAADEQAGRPGALAAGTDGAAPGPRPGGSVLSREEMMKQFDKDGDGQLNDTEREAMRTAMAARFGGQGRSGGQRLSREEMLKRYDKNSDGELDESERAAMREATGGGRSNRRPEGEGGASATPAGNRPARPQENRGQN